MAIALGLKMKMRGLSALVAAVVTTGLQAWHKFTASAWSGSNRLPDSSPVATNTAALFTGRGLSFDGVNDVVTIGATGVTVKTVVFYAYPDTTTQSFMQLQSTGAVRIQIASGTLSATGFTSPTLYVNGAASSTVAATTWQMIAVTSATGVSASNVLLGQQNTTYLSGDLSNVKFFSTQLSAAQIAELYANPEQILPTGSVAADLVGWWQLSANMSLSLDSCGTNPGSVSGATFISSLPSPVTQTGLLSSSSIMGFDSSNDYISGIRTLSGLSAFSVMCWIYPEKNAAEKYIYINAVSSTNKIAIVTYSGVIRAAVNSGGVMIGACSGAYTTSHLTVCYQFDGTTYRLYINDVLQVGTLGPDNLLSFTTTVNTIGGDGTTSRYFNGIIYKVATYDKALSTTEMTNLIAGAAPSSVSNLYSYYLNTGTANSNWTNLQGGGGNGTVNGSPTLAYLPAGKTAGRDGGNFPLINSNSNNLILSGGGYASIADTATLDITTAITLEAWVKPFVVNVAQTIIGKTGSYALGITSGGKPVFTKWTSAASTATATTSTTLTANTWAHIAAVYDGVNVKLYINGALNTTTAVTGAMDATAANVLLGALTTSTELFNGYIDSAKVYDDDLTADNILTNYTVEASEYA